MTRAALLFVCIGCAHAPERVDEVVPGELMVGTVAASSSDAVLEAVALEGYRFEYVAAASETAHLVKVVRADGSALDVAATRALAGQLGERGGKVKYVEVNTVRQPR
ncbi:MAG: hypothetical protein JNK82_38550 [Myxococcaceae bacterium]|nr:hypothetical protein [Myxococcaceae bacterium]